MQIRIAATLLILFSGASAYARPEYAAREKLSCTACHATPWGGGPRNVMGKAYGTRGEEGSKTLGTDLYYGDLRSVAYWPFKATSQSNSGPAVMEAALSGNVPVVQNNEGSEVRAVVTYNLSPLAGSQLREGYVRYSPTSEDVTPTYWTIGHFYVPFGLLTDEHRTYVRIQTNMTVNNYDTGAAYSRDLSPETHVDLVAVNDFQSQGTFAQKEISLGTVGNLRWNPSRLPFLLGTSVNYQRISTTYAPWAVSTYGVLSLDRMNGMKYTGSILWELVYAKNWNNSVVNTGGLNPSLPQFFSTNTGVNSSLATSSSVGDTFRANWDISRLWQVFYKLDMLALNTTHLDRMNTRHGVGFVWRLNSNMYLDARGELATYPSDQTSLPPFEGKESDFFTMLRLWF